MKNKLKAFFSKLRFNLSAKNSPLFIGYYKYFYSPKPNTTEGLLSAYSKDIGDSFTVIQIGANDGINHDPIHKFIKRDKWGGVLLEPQKYVFDTFLRKIYSRHDNLHLLNAAMGEKDGKASIYKIGFCNSRWATGLTTFHRPTLEKAFESGHVERKCAKEGIVIPEDKTKHIVEEEVKIICSESLLTDYNIEKIDLLMIDTEGFDFEIVKLFNIEETGPGLIIFEHSHLSEEDYNECISTLRLNDYVTKKDGPNTLGIKKWLQKYPAYFKK
jgi:FkbM family methyltransferase